MFSTSCGITSFYSLLRMQREVQRFSQVQNGVGTGMRYEINEVIGLPK